MEKTLASRLGGAARVARTMRGRAMIVAASTAAYQVKATVHPVSS